jgi:CBS domain-containing membrane protein
MSMGGPKMEDTNKTQSVRVEISEQDVLEAMKAIQGYLDITPGDFKEIYQVAYSLAVKRLLTSRKAADLMTKAVQVVCQEVDLVNAAALLAEKQISGAPVVDNEGKIVGVVSEKDFLKEMGFGATPSFMQIATHCLNNKGCMIGNLRNRTVGDIMTRPAITGVPEMTIGDISALLVDRRINRLPIINADGRPVGIVTRTDLAHSYNFFGEESKL